MPNSDQKIVPCVAPFLPGTLLDSRRFEGYRRSEVAMHNEFTAVFERDGDWYVAYSPEIPGANGQGTTKEEARQSLSDAIALILADRREEALARGC